MSDIRRPEHPATQAVTRAARGGRPSKLTPRVEGRILAAIRAGHTRSSAAALAGISQASLYRYLAAGDERCRRFQLRVAGAEAELADRVLGVIMEHVPDDPRLALSLSTRRLPNDWGAGRTAGPQQVPEEQAPAPPLVNILVVDPEHVEDLARQRLQQRRVDGVAATDLRLLREGSDEEPLGEGYGSER
jgi:hypothetical protein